MRDGPEMELRYQTPRFETGSLDHCASLHAFFPPKKSIFFLYVRIAQWETLLVWVYVLFLLAFSPVPKMDRSKDRPQHHGAQGPKTNRPDPFPKSTSRCQFFGHFTYKSRRKHDDSRYNFIIIYDYSIIGYYRGMTQVPTRTPKRPGENT